MEKDLEHGDMEFVAERIPQGQSLHLPLRMAPNSHFASAQPVLQAAQLSFHEMSTTVAVPSLKPQLLPFLQLHTVVARPHSEMVMDSNTVSFRQSLLYRLETGRNNMSHLKSGHRRYHLSISLCPLSTVCVQDL